MTKADLIKDVGRAVEMSGKDAEVIVDTIFENIVKSLRSGDKIEIRGFGSFRTRQRNARIGRNPKTGARVDVPAKKIPFFKPSKELKDLVNSVQPGEAPAASPAPLRQPALLRPKQARELHAAAGINPMDYLWSPWRYRYVSQADKATECVFCKLAEGELSRDRETLVIHRGQSNFIVLNMFPYTTAHALVVPYAHVAQLPQLEKEATGEMMALAQKLQAAIEETYHPDGYNLGMNLGKAAGAGVAEHLHLHFVPRWTGSSNFMTVVAETRVLPEELLTTYDKLAPFFRR